MKLNPSIYAAAVAVILSGPLAAETDQLPSLGTAQQQQRYQDMDRGARGATHRAEMQERMKNMSPEERQAMGMGRNQSMQGAESGQGNMYRERNRSEDRGSRSEGNGSGMGGGHGRGGGRGR